MKERLDNLFDGDTRSRWRIIIFSSLAVSVFGFIAQSSGVSLRDAQIGATAIGGIIFCAQVFFYVIPAKEPAEGLQLDTRPYLVRLALAAAVATLLAIAASASAPVVEAAVLNRRLRNALEQRRADPNMRAIATNHIVAYAMHSQLKLRSDLVATATGEFGQVSTPEAWKAYETLVNYYVNWRASKWNAERLKESMHELDSMGDAPPCGPSNEGYSLAEVFLKEGKFETVEDRKPWPHMIHGCRLVLDGKTLKDTFLANVIIEYRGGPVTLENVRVSTAKFELINSENARKLADAILRADSNVVTLTIK
jgi:hypothetical protein